ncbi:hypothetical protein EIP86_000897 [Pleurotus ostreatoroseus]|nr:hypothetical protein EIP86_000897 [Pleurotus ostreatoroseus]
MAPPAVASKEFPNEAIKVALAQSLVDGSFTDTTYTLYSRRGGEGKVGAPRKVYACSAVLKAVGQHFRAQLDGGFMTNEKLPIDTDSYGYESDSDLDEDEDLDHHIADESEMITDSTAQKTEASRWRPDDASEEPCSEYERIENDHAERETTGRKGKAVATQLCADVVNTNCRYNIVVHDVAANTWQALVYYIYTGKIAFAPLRSQGLQTRADSIRKYSTAHPGLPTPVSPKSIYRLADIVGLDELKKTAEQDIMGKLSIQTIVMEVFSWFSSIKKAKEIVQGRLPHTENVLEAIFQRISSSAEKSENQPGSEVATGSTTTEGVGHLRSSSQPSQSPFAAFLAVPTPLPPSTGAPGVAFGTLAAPANIPGAGATSNGRPTRGLRADNSTVIQPPYPAVFGAFGTPANSSVSRPWA